MSLLSDVRRGWTGQNKKERHPISLYCTVGNPAGRSAAQEVQHIHKISNTHQNSFQNSHNN
jgi:hypothetical protein